MKNSFKIVISVFSLLFLCSIMGCASNKGEKVKIDSDSFTSKIVLIASGPQRLVKFEMPDNQLLPDTDTKAIKAASLTLSFYSGEKPEEGEKEGTPVAVKSFDLLKESDKLIKGYDLMSNEKDLKISAQDLNAAFSKNQYYYAKGVFEATVKEGSTVTKTITIFSNNTVYTPLSE